MRHSFEWTRQSKHFKDDGIETDRECCIFAGLFIVFSLFLSSVVSSELLGSTLGVKSRDDTELEDEDGK